MNRSKNRNTKKQPTFARCPKCGYTWETRVIYPKSCPECKTRLGWYKGKLTGRKKES